MKKINDKLKFIIPTPTNYITGGIEASYQLCDAINSQNGNGYILWVGEPNKSIPEEYSNYFINEIAEDLLDEYCVVIFPESMTDSLHDSKFKKCKKAIWWLSVDNHYLHSKLDVDFKNDELIHLYQSHYAKNFLINSNAKNFYPLYDYLNDKYFQDFSSVKVDVICYSIKGAKFAQVVENFINAKMVMLQGYTRDQLFNILNVSKVFIDFGNHPGKDRIPRESAMRMNCVITNRKGSAANEIDIPILNRFKTINVDQSIETINDCLKNYNENILLFSDYRERIKKQKKEFFNQANNFCLLY